MPQPVISASDRPWEAGSRLEQMSGCCHPNSRRSTPVFGIDIGSFPACGGPVRMWRVAAGDKVFDVCYTLYIRLSFRAHGAIGSTVGGCARLGPGLGPQFSFAAALGALVSWRLIDSRHDN